MARDIALQARAAAMPEAVFSIYSWERPTLSLGRNQSAAGLYDVGRIRAAGVDVVRRPTGGRAVLHHHEVTYSVTAAVDDETSLHEAYSRINRILLGGLARLGAVAEPASATRRHPAPGIRPCFDAPAEGELTVGGRKLVGSAQWRNDNALLQHGSILVDDDQCTLHSFTTGRDGQSAEPAARPATLAALLDRSPDAAEVARAMFDAVRSLEDPDAAVLTEQEIRADTLRHVPRFLDEEWTWRR